MNQTCTADQAHLRSHSGPGSSSVLSGCPSNPEFRVEPLPHFGPREDEAAVACG